MQLEDLFEAINRGYYSLPVIDVITNYPLEFLRMFFDEFEKKIFKIKPEDKLSIYDRYRRDLEEKRNIFLDTFNRNEIKLNPIIPSTKKTYRDNIVEITFNVFGSKLRYTIEAGYGHSSNDMTMSISKMTAREFLEKFMGLIKEIYDVREYEKSWLGTLDQSNKELYKQYSTLGKELNKTLENFYIQIDADDKYYRNQTRVQLKPFFKKLIPDIEDKRRFYSVIHITESFLYDFQFQEFERCKKYILSYLNRRNLWVSRMGIDDYSIEFFCDPSNSPDSQNKDYRDGWTYRKLQESAIESFIDTQKKYRTENKQRSRYGYDPSVETVDDFRKYLVKKALTLKEE